MTTANRIAFTLFLAALFFFMGKIVYLTAVAI